MEVARAAVFICHLYSMIDNFDRTDGRRSSDLANRCAICGEENWPLLFVVLMNLVLFCCLQLQCRARVRHISINTFTPQVHSEEFFAGIQILSPNPMQLIEGRED
jgi:hypothetical protein